MILSMWRLRPSIFSASLIVTRLIKADFSSPVCIILHGGYVYFRSMDGFRATGCSFEDLLLAFTHSAYFTNGSN